MTIRNRNLATLTIVVALIAYLYWPRRTVAEPCDIPIQTFTAHDLHRGYDIAFCTPNTLARGVVIAMDDEIRYSGPLETLQDQGGFYRWDPGVVNRNHTFTIWLTRFPMRVRTVAEINKMRDMGLTVSDASTYTPLPLLGTAPR